MHMKNHSAFRRMRGLSLIELLIAVVLGSLVVAAVGNVYLSSTRTYRTQEGLARLQEGARFAFETMTYDIRMAGFTGCSSATSVNVLSGTNWYGNLFSQPLMGYEAAPAVISANVVAGDSLQVLRADNSNEYSIDSHNPTAAQFQLAANHDLKQGEILVATDCSHSVTFQMTNVNNNNTIDTVVHNTGTATPGNCTKGFGESAPGSGVPLCTANGVEYTFGPGSHLLRLSGNIYYIGNNPNNEPSLYRLRLTAAGGNAATVAEELVEGVEDMQITYGEDTTQVSVPGCPDDNCSVDAYVHANAVTDWKRVVSARITLTMRTADNLSTESGADSRIRRTFTTTIALRNRL